MNSFSFQFACLAQSWKTPRRVVTKVEWHPGELYPRVSPVNHSDEAKAWASRLAENIGVWKNMR
jgi:hypothetical protein